MNKQNYISRFPTYMISKKLFLRDVMNQLRLNCDCHNTADNINILYDDDHVVKKLTFDDVLVCTGNRGAARERPGGLCPPIPEEIRTVGNGAPTTRCLIHTWSHKIQWVSRCLCKIFFPSPTLSQTIVIIQTGLS